VIIKPKEIDGCRLKNRFIDGNVKPKYNRSKYRIRYISVINDSHTNDEERRYF
jgi:disulfide oxidoreductase YuzD